MSGDLERRWLRLVGVRDQAVHVVRARIARPEEAEDLVHEALLRLAARPVLDVDDTAGLRALVVRTASCLAVDRWRRQQRQARAVRRLAAGAVSDSPENRVADRSEAAWLAGGLPALGRMERAALLHAVDGRHVEEIARLLGVGYKAAENALGRARRKMRVRAAAAAALVADLLRRAVSRPEGAQVAAMVPVVAAAILLLPSAAAPRQHPTAPQARVSSSSQPGSVLAHARLTAVNASPASAPGAGRAAASTPVGGATTAAAGATGGGPSSPGGPLTGLPVTVTPGPPEHGRPLLVVAGTPVLYEPTTNLQAGPIHGWDQATHLTCVAGDPACPPLEVG